MIRFQCEMYLNEGDRIIKKTIISFLSALILVSGIWTIVLSQERIRIAVVPKSNTAIFLKSVHAGVKLGAVALGGVEVVWRSPLKDDDLAQQISMVEQCITEGMSGIALAPLDKEALDGLVAKGAKGKIPVLIFDSVLCATHDK